MTIKSSTRKIKINTGKLYLSLDDRWSDVVVAEIISILAAS
jgi:hypothetical protein